MSTMRPYKHQIDTVNFLDINDRAFIASTAGVGKSATIVLDISNKLRFNPMAKALILAPKSLLDTVWKNEFTIWAPHITVSVATAPTAKRLAAFKLSANVYVTNTDALKWLSNQPQEFWDNFETVVIDESTCFPAGTMINLVNGQTPIELVQIGDKIVTSSGINIVTNILTKSTTELISINNGLLECTPEHRIFTNVGWIEAKNLKKGIHTLYTTQKVQELWRDIPSPEKGKSYSNFLQSTLLTEISKSSFSNQSSEFRRTYAKSIGGKTPPCLQELWDKFYGYTTHCSVLWSKMFRKIQIQNKSKHTTSFSKRSKNEKTNPLESRKSYELRTLFKNEKSSAPEQSNNTTPKQTRKWYGFNRLRETISTSIITFFSIPVHSKNTKETPPLSLSLQDRFCRSKTNDSYRSRWKQSQQPGTSKTRYKETDSTRGIRVESVSRQKLGSKTDVYDLSIKNSPTFYANGILVHNCIANDSARTKAAMKIKKYFKYRRCMSGTPTSGLLTQLYYQYFFLDDGAHLGNSWYRFRNQVLIGKQTGPSPNMLTWSNKPGKEIVLANLLKDITIRHVLDEVIDMPPQVFYTYKYKPNSKIYKAYTELKRTLKVQLKNKTITAINASALIQKLSQVASGFLIDTATGKAHLVDYQRYELVLDLCDQYKHAVVFFRWTAQREYFMEIASKRKITATFIDGSVAQKHRNSRVKEFQAGAYDVIFLQPQSSAHGLTLHAANVTIWSCPTYLSDYYSQGNNRVYRSGQTKRTTIIDIECIGTIDSLIYQKLKSKLNAMELLHEAL